MPVPTVINDGRNSLQLEARAADLEAEAHDRLAEAGRLRAQAKRLRADEVPGATVIDRGPAPLLTKKGLAAALSVSTAHVTRLEPPAVIVGDDKTKRYDLGRVLAWLESRAPAPTTPLPRAKADDIDVADALARGGLRSVGGLRK